MRVDSASPTKISIIVPIYNELRHISQLLDRVVSAPVPAGCSKERIVVDDGSTDGTTQLLDTYARDGRIKLHKSILNFGKGVALRIGFRYASGEILLVQDGDLEYDPREYPRLLQPILDGAADVVYGSRFRGVVDGMDGPHRIANWILTHTANLIHEVPISYHSRTVDEGKKIRWIDGLEAIWVLFRQRIY